MADDAYEWGIYATFNGRRETHDVILTEYEESKSFISDEEKQQCDLNGGYCEKTINDPFYIEVAWRQMEKIINWLQQPPPTTKKSDMVLIKYVSKGMFQSC